MPQDINEGSHVWVRDCELTWIDGIVTSVDGAEAQIQTSDDKTVIQNLFLHFFCFCF